MLRASGASVLALACGPSVGGGDGSGTGTSSSTGAPAPADTTSSPSGSSSTTASADESTAGPCELGEPGCPCGPDRHCDEGSACAEDTCIPIEGSCGDGIVDPGEECDDGDLTDADGCNADCRPSGSVRWSWFHDGSGVDPDCALGAAVDSSDAIVVVGYESRTDLGLGDVMWLTRLDPSGAVTWTSPDLTEGRATAVAVGPDDRFVIGGDVEMGVGPAWTQVREPSGTVVTTVDWPFPGPAAATESTSEGVMLVAASDSVHGVLGGDSPWSSFAIGRRFYSLAATDDGGFVAAGFHLDGAGPRNAWAARFDAAHQLQWEHLARDVPPESWVHGVAVDGQGNVIIAGHGDAAGSRDAWVRKLDPAGSPLWTHTHDSGGMLDDEALGVAIDGHDRIVVAGLEGRTGLDSGTEVAWIRKLDPEGTPMWTSTQAGPDGGPLVAHGVAIDSLDRITVVGCERVADPEIDSDTDAWVAQLSP